MQLSLRSPSLPVLNICKVLHARPGKMPPAVLGGVMSFAIIASLVEQMVQRAAAHNVRHSGPLQRGLGSAKVLMDLGGSGAAEVGQQSGTGTADRYLAAPSLAGTERRCQKYHLPVLAAAQL